ncbi:DUF4124 domain-containing protein [Allohahella marinimesophila]|uniref:DUF4124 domain-containing protein n=1 Tax=Allohahella marinimesophila TaxID=1054972 RepID=A0ABP7Q2Y6_9GAMM
MKAQLIKIVFALGLCSVLTGAKVYKWVDAQGQVHFGTQPPPAVLKEAEVSKVSVDTPKIVRIEEVLEGRWYMLDGSLLHELVVYDTKVNWNEYEEKLERTARGEWQLTGPTLRIAGEKIPGGTAAFTIKSVAAHEFTAYWEQTDRIHTFRKLADSRYELSSQEEMLNGDWAEVSASDLSKPVAKFRFDSGRFYTFPVVRKERVQNQVNINHVRAEGNWEIEEQTLVIRYFKAFGQFANRALTTERLAIKQMNKLGFAVTDSQGNIRNFIKIE